MALAVSCADYLDVVPEMEGTMDNAFSNRVNSEKFLYTCYSYMPNPVDVWLSPALIGIDEIWWNIDNTEYKNQAVFQIAQGRQNVNSPYLDYWNGPATGKRMFTGIRDCNIFLENIHRPVDLNEAERRIWTAEVKFLKAYYHFYLLRLYGPIPIIRENLPVNASPEEVRVYREPVDDVVEYIVQLLDEATPDLMLETFSTAASNMGRITKPIALAIKAQALVWAASPLFNGNEEYQNVIDNKKRHLFSVGEPDIAKWRRAAVAIKNAIDTCQLAGHTFVQYVPTEQVSDVTRQKYMLRSAITQKSNTEIIWPATQDNYTLQAFCMPYTNTGNIPYQGRNELGATLKIAEQFYTKNGLPLNEDPEWDYAGRYDTKMAAADHRYYIKTGEVTAKLNFDREPRFYAWLCFDKGVFEGSGKLEAESHVLEAKLGQFAGYRGAGGHHPTGYFIKKLIHPLTDNGPTTYYKSERYSFPIIRLSDLFLLYAEALNEADGPSPEVYRWIDTVRTRAGLEGVEASWAKAAPLYQNKPYKKEDLRKIIKQERLIELCFEGQRFWDLRRWKDAMTYLNQPVQGWNYLGETTLDYYQVKTYWLQNFRFRDYLLPIHNSTMLVNANLEQNPGWK
jgi:hypothetical protein